MPHTKFAFLIHPISDSTSSLIDLQRGTQLRDAWGQDPLLFCARYHEAVQAVRQRGPLAREVRVVDEITGLLSSIGAQATGRLYEIPFYPVDFLESPHRALDLMRAAIRDAQDWGAQLVGLGGLTAIVGGHGTELNAETELAITTGNSLTSFAALQAVYQVCDELELDLHAETVAVVGIPGSIAAVTAKLLAPKVGHLLLVSRSESGRARSLARDLGGELLLDISQAVKRAQIVITATSSGSCIEQSDLCPGCIVVDVAVPTDVVGARAERQDVLILSGGQTRVPSTFARTSSFLWFNHGIIPSCLGETIVLALDDRIESFSLGRNLEPDKVLEIGLSAQEHGFDFSMLRSFGLPLEDTQLVNVRKVIHRSRLVKAVASWCQASGLRVPTNGEDASPRRIEDGAAAVVTRPADIADTARKHYGRHVNPVLTELTAATDFAKTLVRSKGAYLEDKDGIRYLDFVSGFGSANLGHHHPQVVAALRAALDHQAPGFAQSSINPYAAALADRLATLTPAPLDVTFFTNSGTESVEAALKLARKATGRHRFLYCHRSYHGKSLGSLSVTGNRAYQQPFAPLLDSTAIPFGDLHALRCALERDEFAAFLVEPIQAEGGFHVPPDQYLPEAAEMCRRHHTLLIIDEVQSGLGRTGRMFAIDHWNVQPDIMTLAKSLGGGLMPIGAMMCARELWLRAYGNVSDYLLHSTTFGGGSLACAAALATLDVLQDGQLIHNAAARGEQLMRGLQEICRRRRTPLEARGRGLLLGLEFQPMSEAAAAHWKQMEQSRLSKYLIPNLDTMLDSMSTLYVMQTLLHEHQIHTQVTRSNPLVLRIQPPLTITAEEVNRFLAALDMTIGEVEFEQSSIQDVMAKTGLGRHEKKTESPPADNGSSRYEAAASPVVPHPMGVVPDAPSS